MIGFLAKNVPKRKLLRSGFSSIDGPHVTKSISSIFNLSIYPLSIAYQSCGSSLFGSLKALGKLPLLNTHRLNQIH